MAKNKKDAKMPSIDQLSVLNKKYIYLYLQIATKTILHSRLIPKIPLTPVVRP